MSSIEKLRYLLAAACGLSSLGLVILGEYLAAVPCLIAAVLMLPILYRWLCIRSNYVQLASPMLFVTITVLIYGMMQLIPQPYTAPLKSVYTEVASTTTAIGSDQTVVTTTVSHQDITTTTTVLVSVNHTQTVYRTPSGKRYHLLVACGGENAYEVSLDDALQAGLTPCKKCAGG